MANSHKAFWLREQIAADLAIQMPTVFGAANQVKAFDTSGNPILNLGTLGVPATGEQCAVIRVKELTSPFTDVLGLTQDVWTPHVIQVALETSASANLAFVTAANLTLLLATLLKYGVRLEVYMRTTGTEPVVADMVAAKLIATFDAHVQYPLAGQ